jgi:hypothetical protein
MTRTRRQALRGADSDREDDLVQLATRVPKSLHRAVRVHCIETETSVMQMVTQAIAEKLRRSPRDHVSGRSGRGPVASAVVGEGRAAAGKSRRSRRAPASAGTSPPDR